MEQEFDELLKGLSLWEAEEIALELGYITRVAVENGVDFGEVFGNPKRLNIEMKAHKVERVIKIG